MDEALLKQMLAQRPFTPEEQKVIYDMGGYRHWTSYNERLNAALKALRTEKAPDHF